MKAKQNGEEEPQMLRNFIEFLYIFGHFVRAFITSDLVLLDSLIHSW